MLWFYKITYKYSEDRGRYTALMLVKLEIQIKHYPSAALLLEHWCYMTLGPRIRIGYNPYVSWHFQECDKNDWAGRLEVPDTRVERIHLILTVDESNADRLVGKIVLREPMFEAYHDPYHDLSVDQLRSRLRAAEARLKEFEHEEVEE